MFKSIIAHFVIFVISLASEAIAEDYPFSGYFSQEPASQKSGFLQAKCARVFFYQDKDGKATGYILDEKLYKDSGKVQFRVAGKTTCFYQSDLNKESCITDHFFGQNESEHFVFFGYYPRPEIEPIQVFFFENGFEINRYIASPKVDQNIDNFPNREDVIYHRCEGFDETSLKGHLSDNLNTLSYEISEKYHEPSFPETEISSVLDIMQKIGKTAFNATLPGQ